MSKLFAIVAMENMYGGYHGIKDSCVVECLNRDEAEEIGIEMSINLMDTYGISDEIAENIIEDGIDKEDEEFQIYLDEAITENILYEIYEIRDTTKSLAQLNDLLFNYEEEFIKKYCIENF